MSELVFGTHNAAFVQVMYEEFLRDPQSVPEEWRLLFGNGGVAGLPVLTVSPAELEAGLEAGAGSGEQGAAEPTAPSAVPVAETPAPGSPLPAPGAPAPGSLLPLSTAAARLAQNMTTSLSVPTATSFRDIAAGVLEARRKALNAALAPQGRKVSFTHLIGFAIARAAHEFPVMTHAFREIDGKPHRFDPRGVHLGLAVDIEKKDGSRALVVPVIRGADAMDFAAFHATYETLVEKARSNRLLPDDFAGATMSLTNPGTLGTVASVPRLMTGQGSIIATGAIRDLGSAGRVMTITSTYDHRIIQGAESGMFLRRLDALLQGEAEFYEGVAGSLGLPGAGSGEQGAGVAAEAPAPSSQLPAPIADAAELRTVVPALGLVRAHRYFGHRAAHLDPLGRPPKGDPALDPSQLGLSPEMMERIPSDILRVYVPGRTLADAYHELQKTYCGTIAYEMEHIGNHEERVWLRRVIESGEHRRPVTADEQRRLLARLTEVEALERFLHKAYLGQKRFSIEGLEILVPMLDLLIELAAAHGARDVVMGMAHRGRLNVLAHIVGLPYETIFAEFEGGRHVEETLTPEGGTGDVKYHHGATGVYHAAGGHPVTVTLSPNPSHLEAVNPVIEGRTRAIQTARRGREAAHDSTVAVPVLIHGDAAFAAQGVVAETFNLERLRGYTTGGTVHLIANNQIGFTTDPEEGRSTDYSSDLAKGFDVPIIHVNADDPDACLAAVRLAMMYRERFRGDVVIDVVGYRRWGHNEGDEPSYTQPTVYDLIRETAPVSRKYGAQLEAAGVLTAGQLDADAEAAYRRLADRQQALKASLAKGVRGEEPQRISRVMVVEPETAVPADVLMELNEELLAVPEGFTVNPKLKKQLERRREALAAGEAIEWAHAEALALGSLLCEGVPIRLTGQDTERGTFSQRHLVLHDARTGERHVPIERLADARAPLELHNSPLSENACLGFEYGYALQSPEALVLWEAQFGDFANGAEVIIDQFIIAGLAKWAQTSRLTVLLPHGYEGQGPEHSSARVERYLALGAEGNIRVANCTTPAQYFHLLRRQAKHAEMRPLIVMTPKSLLRLPAATSRTAELTAGRFQPVLDDPERATSPADVTRLVLCSGKIYYDLLAHGARAASPRVAVGRIELLYPFPALAVEALAGRYPALREVCWVQEEPWNMGPRKFIVPQIEAVLASGITVSDVSRPERSSPAEGYPAVHQAEQQRIVREAFGTAS